ncbi:MAG: hypothetical protein J7501_08315 [Bdellovibrio sp.]|nr:hypothetical protein [Bdellovibrio sp.]
MIRYLTTLKDQAVKLYEAIKELEKLPMRNFQGDFYEEKEEKPVRIKRQTTTSVEDLRPQRPDKAE